MIRSLGLLCCLLTGAVAAELIELDRPLRETAAVTGADLPPVAMPLGIRSADAQAEADRSLAVVLGRPLFTPDRRPAADAVAADAGMPRLTGIIASSGGAVAIFQAAGTARPVVVRHGDAVDGWRVMTVTAESVALRKDRDRVVLTPRFAGSQTGLTARAAPLPPATRWEAAAADGVLRARWSNPQLQP